MNTQPLFLAIDQGTTSTRALLFNACLGMVGQAHKELPQSFPQAGWVEHNPHLIWQHTLDVCQQVFADYPGSLSRVASLGITNQRETIVLWDRRSGEALHPAIVWQDRRTTEDCARKKSQGLEAEIRQRTGLLLDPYFSATKITWLLEHVDGARAQAEQGHLAVGTIDSWLLWNLSGGQVHATDPSNASRTLLYHLQQQRWDPWLCEQFQIPPSLLPEVLPSCGLFGHTAAKLFGRSIPIGAILGDQQAATLGQGCFTPGSMKCTFGTGAFAMQNTGSNCLVESENLLTTVLWQNAETTHYALEGSIFSAGSTMQWLRDGLHLFQDVTETEAMAHQADPNAEVYLVPAFNGLGAPWWDPNARAALLGVTRGTGPAEIVRAGLEATCFQTRDLLETARADGAQMPSELRVDGGLCNNLWFLQFLADILNIPIVRPNNLETTATGAAFCAALQSSLCSLQEVAPFLHQESARFDPKLSAGERESRYHKWRQAVKRTLSLP